MMRGFAIAAFGLLEEDPHVCFVRHGAAPSAASEGGHGSFGTAASEAALRSRARFERLPGRLIPNDDHMYFDEEIITELDLMPLMWRKAGYALFFRGVPVGQAHRPDEPCPYQGRDFARNSSLHCCWLRGEKVYWELTKLDALFDGTLAAELATDKCTAEEALAFADKLRKLADEHEVVHREERTPGIRGSVREIDASGMFVSEVRYSTFEEVLATLRKTADWFEITGRLGFGVRVWG